MLLNYLSLRNFKSFEGDHELHFTGLSEHANVHLIGALNGAGKTSLVQALLLSLYGSAAAGMPGLFVAGRDHRRQYEQWISAAWNANARRNNDDRVVVGCALGTSHETVEVQRTFWLNADGSYDDEELRVSIIDKTGKVSTHSGDEAAERISEVIPRHVAELTFFDGERVSTVDRPSAGPWIVNALDKLLNLEPVKRTQADIARLAREKRALLADEGQVRAYESLQRQLAEFEAEAQRAQNELSNKREALTDMRTDLSRLDDHVSAHLSDDAPLSVAQLENEAAGLDVRRKELRDRLGRQMGDWLYLDLVSDLLNPLRSDASSAIDARRRDERQRADVEAVDQYRQRLLADPALRRLLDSPDDSLGEHLRRLMPQINPDSDSSELWTQSFSYEELEDVVRGAQTALGRDREEVTNLAIDLREVDRRIDEIETLRTSMGNQVGLESAIRSRDELQKSVRDQQDAISSLVAICSETRKKIGAVRSSISRLDSKIDESDGAAEWLTNAGKINSALTSYIQASRSAALAGLAEGVLNRIRPLLRKTNLVTSVAIDPDTYEVVLRDAAGIQLRLPSAGEQQLAAIAFASAMLDLADEALPMIIDTPLARLDGQHRKNFVENLLPAIGRQVILLSTDEEIDASLYGSMTRSIARSFAIKHDDETNLSNIESDNYFSWETSIKGTA